MYRHALRAVQRSEFRLDFCGFLARYVFFFLGTRTRRGARFEGWKGALLCRRGHLALLTPKNNPIFDVVATSSNGSKSISIQVKTSSIRNKQGWKLAPGMASEAHPKGLFVVLVNLHESALPDFYIYQYLELAKRVQAVYAAYMAKPKRDGTAKKKVVFHWFDEVSFTEDDNARKNNWKPIESALHVA